MLPFAAQAQQVVDGHGEVFPPLDPNTGAPVELYSPWALPRGSWSVGGMFGLADEPLVQYSLVGPGQVERLAVLDDVLSLDLAGRYVI